MRALDESRNVKMIWSLNGCNNTHVKPKLLRRRKGVHESFSSLQKSQKSLILTTLWNSTKLLNNYPEIIVHQRLTDPRQMVLLREL